MSCNYPPKKAPLTFPFSDCQNLILTTDELIRGVNNCKSYCDNRQITGGFAPRFDTDAEFYLEYYANILEFSYVIREESFFPQVKNNKNKWGFTNYSQKIVCVKDDLYSATHNNTCAHELFHLLHHTKFISQGINPADNSKTESQAVEFARCFLLPEELFKQRLNHWHGFHKSNNISLPMFKFVIGGLIRDFNASAKLCVKRGKMLGVIDRKTADEFMDSKTCLFGHTDDYCAKIGL